MCTVTFVPIKNGVILTSNRDEQISRGNAAYPEFYYLSGKHLVFPKDRSSGGTWFISNEKGDIGVLLNGAFEKHLSSPPYAGSRGLILPQVFQNDSPLTAIKHYPFTGIENFTIILWQQKELWDIKWNGNLLHMERINPKFSHIWSSITLYSPEMALNRQKWFNEWRQKQSGFDQKDLVDFHTQTQKYNKEYGLQIARNNGIATVSTTSIKLEGQEVSLIHKDMLQTIDISLTYSLSQLAQIYTPVSDHAENIQKN